MRKAGLLPALLPATVVGWFSQQNDWLVSTAPPAPTKLMTSPDGTTITLSNGLISRTFVVSPCFATIEYMREDTQTTFIRGLSPEATFTLNGATTQAGGCVNTDPHANAEFWTPETAQLAADPLSLNFSGYRTSPPVAPFPWTPGAWHSPSNTVWPPAGLTLSVDFAVGSGSVPSINGTTFDTIDGYEFPCGSGGCLTGWPTCNNVSVAGQCSWDASVAQAECAKWPACAGVNCNKGRSDCQARAAPFVFQSQAGFSTTYRSGPNPAAGAVITVNYEMYDGLPVLRKWLSAKVGSAPGGAQSFVIDTVIHEILKAPVSRTTKYSAHGNFKYKAIHTYLLLPPSAFWFAATYLQNFAPDQMTVIQVQANNPTPATQQVVPVTSQSFPGRTQQYWFFDDEWDACCDRELHVPYTYYTLLRVGYGDDVTFGGPTGPGALVTESNPWEGQSTRFILHDTTDWDRQGAGIRKMQSIIAPQLLATPIVWMISDISTTAAFQTSLTQASQAGIELVIIGYGAAGWCGMCPGQLTNASFVAWFKSQVQFGAALNPPVRVSAYTLMQMNGWGESVPSEEQVLNRDGSRGGIACFATDFHAAYRQSILDFVDEVGLSGVETDGQYENAACGDDSGDHHHNGVIGSWDAQLDATLHFNEAMKAKGIYQTGADAYWQSGANRWNHADTDAGYSLNRLWDRLNVGRDYIYDSSTTRLHSSGGYGIGDPKNDAKQCDSYPGRLVCVDYALASFYGQGVVPNAVSSTLWDPSDPEGPAIRALYSNWTAFFALHRPVLTSPQVVHLVRPSTRRYEATAFLSPLPTATERAYVSVYNPTNSTQTASLMVPLYYSGLPPMTAVSIWQVGPNLGRGPAGSRFVRNATVGADGGAIYDVSVPLDLPPVSYALYVITLPADAPATQAAAAAA